MANSRNKWKHVRQVQDNISRL